MAYLLLKALILPPGLFIVTGILCALCFRRWPRFAFGLLSLSTLLLYAMSTLYVGKHAIASLEPGHAVTPADISNFKPQAIVVLGADRSYAAPEYGGEDSAGGHLLIRLRYAAHLYRQTGLPILVSGGRGYDNRVAQADVMASILEREFQVPVAWREGNSLTTWENAAYSRDILRPFGVDRVLLVTQAFHMKRSVASLARVGLTVLPAPTYFLGNFDRALTVRDFFPGLSGFQLSNFALHEHLGLAYYQWHDFDSDNAMKSSQ